jgi:hypothetical protein
VHVVAGKVKSNQALENNGPSREGGGEEDDKTGCSTAIGDHIKNSAEASRLFVDTRGIAIEGIEKT